MVNRHRRPVKYRKFKARPLTPEGLLPVAREGGDLERATAAGMLRLADQAGVRADREAAQSAETQGSLDALAAAPEGVSVAPGARPAAPAEIRDMITRIAGEEGADAEILLTFAHIESRYDPAAKNKSGAAGLFQFMPKTAAQYGLANPFDPVANTRAAIRLMNDNAGYLRKVLKREPTAGELYLAHQQGAGGASKLLRNPNALAVDIVGRAAVIQNGGSETMSAQAFANKWIAKASAPGTILSGRTTAPALKVGTGIRSRNYNRSYERTYLAKLDNTMRSDMDKVYEQYKDDPGMLTRSLGELKTAHLNDHVFPEIAADYVVQYDRMAGRLVRQAEAAAEVRLKEQDLADFESRTADLEERKSRLLAGLDPDLEGSEEQLFELQASIDAQYDEAVERGLLSETDASEAKSRSLRETSVQFHVRQADRMPAAELGEYREQLRQDYASGELENVDGKAFEEIDRTLAKLEKDRITEGKKAQGDLRRMGDDLARRHLAGEDVDAAEISAFRLAMSRAPDGKEIGQSALRRLRVAQVLKSSPIAAVRHNLEDLVKRDDGTVDLDDLAFARDLIAKQEEALKSDPIKLAERYGAVPVVGGILDTMQTSGSLLAVAERIDAAELAADRFGVAPKYFTGNEPAEIRDMIRGNPEQGLALVAGIVEAGRDKAGNMLRELREVAPEAEYAGVVLALGGSPQAAQDAILGSIPGADGKTPEKPITKQRQVLTSEVMGGALSQLHPEDRSRVEASAMAIAARRVQIEGVEKNSADAKAIYRQALQEAAGAVKGIDGQLGGFGEVNGSTTLLPPGMSEDDVEDLLDLVTDEDLEAIGGPMSPLKDMGVTVGADDIRDGILLAVAPGTYRVAKERGGRLEFLADPEGGFWELDIHKLAVRHGVARFRTSGGF